MTKIKISLAAALGVAGLVAWASMANAACVTKAGAGSGGDAASAKFQAWEIVAQTTGNWPIATDKLVHERYSCKPEGGQIRCDSKIDVCKS